MLRAFGYRALGGNAFGIVQPITGTSPTASVPNDTLTFTSVDGTVAIAGNSATKTLDFSASSVLANAWQLSGNSGLTTSTNFLGTTDGTDVVFKRNSTEIFRLRSAPNISAFFTSDITFEANAIRTISQTTASGGASGMIIASDSGTGNSGNGGNLTLNAGSAGTRTTIGTAQNAGGVILNGGTGGLANTAAVGTNAGGVGGAVTLSGGTGGQGTNASGTNNGGAGGAVSISGGAGGAGNSTQGIGGDVTITGGAAGSGPASVNGGRVYILGGAKFSSGSDGNVFINTNGSSTRGFTTIGATTTPVSQLHVFSNSTSPITLIAQAQSGQSNDVFQCRDASNNVVNSITSAGLKKTRPGLSTLGTLAGVGCALKTNTTAVSSGTTVETDLITYSLLGSTLGTNGDRIRFRCAGQFSATANTKQVKAKFGATTLLDTTALAITTATDWCIEGEIIRTGATTQVAICSFSSNSTTLSETITYTTPGETLSGAITFKLTGTVGGTGGADITERFHVLEWLPNN